MYGKLYLVYAARRNDQRTISFFNGIRTSVPTMQVALFLRLALHVLAILVRGTRHPSVNKWISDDAHDGADDAATTKKLADG